MDSFRTRRASPLAGEDTGAQGLAFDHHQSLTRSAPVSSRRDLLATGESLREGRITIQEVIGSGGEGVVYRAFDKRRGHVVALKVLHLDDAESIPQLKREFRFLRDLIHPRLVQLHELVVERELSFFTMAFVDGVSFFEAAREFEPTRAMTLQLAEVLAFLHQTGRIHRDIKPTNILVKKSGELVLLDFGIGLDVRARKRRGAAAPVGTPRYMAPEVINMRGASEKSDAYSLGIVLYEALTGEHPLPSGRVDPAQRHPYDPGLLRPDVPEDLRSLVVALTHSDPSIRAGVEDVFDLIKDPDVRNSGVHRVFPSEAPPGERFTGREAEMSRLTEAYERMELGYQPVVVHIEAPSGLGKTALLDRFLKSKQRGIGEQLLVFRGRCSEHEKVLHKAIDGVVEDLVEFLLSLPSDEVLEYVPYLDAEILLQLFPELARVSLFSEIAPETSLLGDYRAMRKRAYLALAATLARVALARPLIVAIDDLQWGDVDSGKLLCDVFAGADRPHCLLLLAYRSEEKTKSPCLQEIFRHQQRISDEVVRSRLELRPLSDAESRKLIVRFLGGDALGPQVMDRVIRESAGSPLLLSELASYLHDAEPRDERSSLFGWGIADIVQARRRRLSPASAASFGLLCCSGARVDVSLLAELSGGEPDEFTLELTSLRLARGRFGGTQLEPFHDAMREAYLLQSPEEGEQFHSQLANALIRKAGDPAEIVRHLQSSGDPRVAEWAEKAGDAASQAFALSSAIEFYQIALSASELSAERREMLGERLADALAASGHGARAGPMYADLAKTAEVDRAASLRRRAAEQLLITGRAHEGSAVVAEVQKEAGLSWPKSASAAVRALLRHRLALSLNGFERDPDKVRARAARLSREERARIQRQLGACRAAWPTSFISTVHGAANSALYLRLAQKSGDEEHLGCACAMEAAYQASSGTRSRQRCEELMQSARAFMPQPSEGYNAGFLKFSQAQVDYLLGDLKQSLDGYDEAEELFLKHGRHVSYELNSLRILHADALFYLGRHLKLDAVFSDWIADARERGDSYLRSALLLARASRTVLRCGNREEAIHDLEEGGAAWSSPYVGYHHLSEAAVRTYVDIYTGRPERGVKTMKQIQGAMRSSFMNQVHVARVQMGNLEAMACLERAADLKPCSERRSVLRRARQIARRMMKEGAPWATAYGLQTDSLVTLLQEPTEAALEQLRQAGRVFQSCDMRLYAAAVDGRRGELIGGDEGRELLEKAHRAFEEVDVCNWVDALSCHTPRVLPR